jgi:hypothetical protein
MIATRGSRRRFAGHRRPSALLKRMRSPSRAYQTTAEKGAPSAFTVASVAKWGRSRKVLVAGS